MVKSQLHCEAEIGNLIRIPHQTGTLLHIGAAQQTQPKGRIPLNYVLFERNSINGLRMSFLAV